MTAISMISQFAGRASVPQPRLVKAAHEFEAQLMKELVSPMTHATGTEDDSDASSAGALADFASGALGQALSMRGGLGMADNIIRSLSRNETSSPSASNSGGAKLNAPFLTAS